MRTRILKRNVERLLRADSLTEAAMDLIERRMAELEKLDASSANDLRVAYVKKMVWIDTNVTDKRLRPGQLERLERVVIELTKSDPSRATSLRQSGAWESFHAVAFPYLHSTSYYSFLRPDHDRVVNLEHVVTIDACVRGGNASIPAEVELFRMYFAQGNAEQAEQVIKRLADRSDLSPAWRMLVLRDYVWLAIWSSSPMPNSEKTLVEDALARVDEAMKLNSSADSVYLPLLVEKARLLVAKGLHSDANQIIDQYFEHFTAGRLSMEFAATEALDSRLGNRPANDNLTARFFLDASLIKGFLLEDLSNRQGDVLQQELQKYWEEQHSFVRGTHVGAYYEGAMLASLARQLDAGDVIRMVNFTAGSARTLGTSPILKELENVPARLLAAATSLADVVNSARRLAATADYIPSVLRNAWVSKRGHSYARQIAYRQISFAEYLNVQIRLWLFEGLMRVVGKTPKNEPETITIARRELLWTATNDAFDAFVKGELSEDTVVQIVHLGTMPEKSADWLNVSVGLPSKLRGPITYILYRHFRDNLKRTSDAQALLEAFQTEVAATPKNSLLAIIAGE